MTEPSLSDDDREAARAAIARRAGVYFWDSAFLLALAAFGLIAEHLPDTGRIGAARAPVLVLLGAVIAGSVVAPWVKARRAGIGRPGRWSSGLANVDHERFLTPGGVRATRITDVFATASIVVAVAGLILLPSWRWSIGVAIACVALAVHRTVVDAMFRRDYGAGPST